MTNADAGRAIRRLTLAERVERVGAALSALSDPGGEAHRRLLDELPAATGFSTESVRAGLGLALAEFNWTGLRRLVEGELGAEAERAAARAPASTAVIPAGAIPMPTFESLAAPLVLGSPVRIRPGSRDPVSARVFADAVASQDASLGAAISIVDFDHADESAARAFLDADAVIAFGGDATIAHLRRMSRPSCRFVAYGHRLSVAVVSGQADAEVAAAIARDVSHWDQLGCLSPLALYVTEDADGWSDLLAAGLERLASDWPRGTIPMEAALATRHARDEAALRQAADPATRVLSGRDWTVVREADATWRSAPLHRFIRVHPLAGLDALEGALAPVASFLSSVAAPLALHSRLSGFGFRRCLPGDLQAPPMHWNHDGIGTLRPLLPST